MRKLVAVIIAGVLLCVIISPITAFASTLLLGNTAAYYSDWSADYVTYARYQASASGTLNQIQIYSHASGNFKAALYSDSNGSPNTLLTDNSTGAPATAMTWNSINVTGYAVTSGTYYWLAVITDTSCVATLSSLSSGTVKYKAIAYAGYGFPATAESELSSYTKSIIIAGYEAITITTPTVISSAATSIGNTYALSNGNITNLGGYASCDHRGVVWSTGTHGDPGNVAPASSGYTAGNVDQSGSYTTGAFSENMTGLSSPGTYYYRMYAHNTSGYAYSSEIAVSTLGPPAITTQAATNIAATTATLNSNIDSDGSLSCSVRFAYDNVTHSGGAFGDYAYSTTLVAGYSVGQTPLANISGLSGATTYYFRAQIQNSIATVDGLELNFATYNSVLCPSSIKAICNSTSISLNWIKGTGSNQTVIRYKTGSYPSSYTDGASAYFGTGESVIIPSLTAGTTYYVAAYGFNGGTYSSTPAQVMGTTIAFDTSPAAATKLVAPTTDSTWTQTPSSAKVATFPVYGQIVQNVATAYNQPVNYLWYFIWMMIAAVLGIVTYLRGNYNYVLASGVMLIWIGIGVWYMNVVAGGVVVLLGVIGLGWSLTGYRRTGG